MIDLTKGIDSLTAFKRDTDRFRKQLKKNRRPVVLTINGKAELVVQDAAAYQDLLARLEEAEIHHSIKQSILDHREGRSAPAKVVLQRIRRKLKIPIVDATE